MPKCELTGPGRGDCAHFVGLPGKSIPGQHDGPDDTVDAWGKPNGWCWQCWTSHRLALAENALFAAGIPKLGMAKFAKHHILLSDSDREMTP